jgi:hypothetical protein
VSSLLLPAAFLGAVRAGGQELPAPLEAPARPSQLSPAEIQIYQWAPTLINWTQKQIDEFPVLHKLRPAAKQTLLPMILDRAGQTGTQAYADFPQIACDETVTSETKNGAKLETKHQKFRYIVIPRPAGDVRMLEEYRTDPSGAPPDKFSLGNLFMLTTGFASTWLCLNPPEQPDNHFRYFGTQSIRNRECHVVGFAQDPESARRVGGFGFAGKSSATLLVQGLVWIDAQTFQILRVMTWLLAPREDVDLSSEITTVDFDRVQPSGSERVLWLPRDVNVWILCRGIGFRNTHHYSDFKLFRVESTIKPAP